MPTSRPPGDRVVRFGVFEADLLSGELRKQGRKLRLQDQPFRLLEALIARKGDVVTREELRVLLWPDDVVVDFDHNLNKAVNKLRIALGDATESPRYIETLPKRGYRWIAPVEIRPAAAEGVAAAGPAEPSTTGAALTAAVTTPAPARSPRRGRRALLWVAGLAAAAAALYVVASRPAAPPSTPVSTSASLVVLPFRNLSSAPDQEYFSDGLTEELIVQLGRVTAGQLAVIATTSAQRYKGSTEPLEQIARELGVSHVLEGSVQRTGDRVRITCRLVRAANQTQVWSDSFERALSDIFAIQTEVSRQVAKALVLKLLPEDRRTTDRPPTASIEAHEAYLRGRYLYASRTKAGLLASIEQFERAVAVDPEFAMGHVGLADSYNLLAEYGNVEPKGALARSRAAATRALEIDSSLAEAHANLGWTHSMSRELARADERLTRAIELNPGYMSAHQWRAGVLRALKRGDEADAEIRRAQELDPVSPIIQSVAGWHHYLAGRPVEAVDQCLRVIASTPQFPRVHSYLGWAYLEIGEPAKGVQSLRRAAELFGPSTARQAELAYGLAAAGETAEARGILKTLTAQAASEYVEADLIARIYTALGENDRAFEWLDRGLAEGAVKLLLLGSDPAFRPLHQDPRFDAFMRRAGLPR